MQQSRRNDAEESWETGVEIAGPAVPGLDEILSAEARAFVAMLERRFGAERRRLLAPARHSRRASTLARTRLSGPRPRQSATANGPSRARRTISPTGGWRSPARWTAR